MRMHRRTAGVVAVICSMAAMSLGSVPGLAAEVGSPASTQWSSISGKVLMVDPKMNKVKIRSGLLQKDFVVSAATKISDGSRALTLDQLQPGADVTIEYARDGDRLLSHSITVGMTAPPAGGQAHSTPEAASPALPAAELTDPDAPRVPAQ